MEDSLVRSMAPRLRELAKGGYARTYRRDANTPYSTSLRAFVAGMLDSLGLDYERDVEIDHNRGVRADFLVRDKILFVDRQLSLEEKKAAARARNRCILINTSGKRSDRFDAGLRIVQLGDDEGERLQTIFLDDPSFNFDYAHILPKTEKCSVMHGHTSSALVEIVGSPREGMVVDFNDAKPIIREAIRDLDHKLFINERYVTGVSSSHVDLAFETVHGTFSLHVPKNTTVLLKGEATVENLAQELLDKIAPRMPSNVEAVGVYVYEGLNKGTHLLAQLHLREAEKRRKR